MLVSFSFVSSCYKEEDDDDVVVFFFFFFVVDTTMTTLSLCCCCPFMLFCDRKKMMTKYVKSLCYGLARVKKLMMNVACCCSAILKTICMSYESFS
jgi:hypothetical protein